MAVIGIIILVYVVRVLFWRPEGGKQPAEERGGSGARMRVLVNVE